jgi:hypothetical protein
MPITAENVVPKEANATDVIAFEKQLEGMKKDELIRLGDEQFGVTIDQQLDVKTIKAELVRQDNARKGAAISLNEASAREFKARGDKLYRVKFHRLDFAEADMEFSYSGTVGMRGPKNKSGFAKCPKFHLYPGESYVLPKQVIDHLKGLTFSTNKPVFDPVTGMISGNQPIIKPRFILEYEFTDSELEKLAQ